MSQVLQASVQDYPFAFAGRQPTMDAKERFYRHFQAQLANLHEKIAQLISIAIIGGERQDATEAVLAGISKLSREVADASDYVPAYDQRTYAQAVKSLTDNLNAETARLAPRSRFQFKPRAVPASSADAATMKQNDPRFLRGNAGEDDKAATAAAAEAKDEISALPNFPKNYNEEMVRPGQAGIRKPSFSAARDITITGHTGLHIILPSSASRATASGSVTDLSGCIVDMSVPTAGAAPFAGLTLKNISGSLVIAGHVNGPAHITAINNSILVVAARQVRIHECHNIDVYLHCTSRPIIEDCKGLRFAPLPAHLMTQSDEPEKNQWDQVDDFKWLKTEPSPNWTVLDEASRIPDNVWTKTVSGGLEISRTDILKKLGLQT